MACLSRRRPPQPITRFAVLKQRAEGHVLMASMLAALGVSVTGASLINLSLRESGYADQREQRRHLFEFSESCLDEAAAWLRAAKRPPMALPYNINRKAADLFAQGENERLVSKLSGYGMNCTITGSPATGKAAVKNDARATREGESVADEGGYGLSGDLSPKVYYWLTAEGSGPGGAKRTTRALLSGRY